MDQARSVVAHFALSPETLTIVSAYGVGTPPVGVYTNLYGAVLTNAITGVQTVGGTQYVATGWSLVGNAPAAGSGTNVVLTQTNNATLTWLWATNYQLTSSSAGNGVIAAGSSTNGFYAVGTPVSVTATPNLGYYFAGWTGDTGAGNTSNPTLNLTMDQARSVVAHFAPEGYTLQIISAHGTGTPTASPTGVVYMNAFNTALTNWMTLVDWPGGGGTQYVCRGWAMTGNGPVSGSITNLTMVQTNNAVLTWLWTTNYMLTIVPPAYGSITNAVSGWKPVNSVCAPYPSNSFGYVFDHWVLNGQNVGAGVPLLVTMDGAKTVTAVFTPAPFMDVSSQLNWSVSWIFDPRSDTFYGTLTISNRVGSGKALLAPIWYEVESNVWYNLLNPSGFDPNTGLYYTNISTQVTNQLAGIGNHDAALDPGETVTVTGIRLLGRYATPTGLVVGVWADLPGAPIPAVDTDGDGMTDFDEYIAGTSATDPNSVFRIRIGPDGHSLEWDGLPGRLYTVLGTTNLLQSFVPVATNIDGTGPSMQYNPWAPSPAPAQFFYRLQVQIKEITP